MTRVDLTKAQCAELANYLRGVLNNGMGAGSFDKIEMLVLARRALAAAEELPGVSPVAVHAPAARRPQPDAAYEDAGREPEEIDMDHEAAETLRQLCRSCDLDRLEELVEADKGGRLVVLPVKPVLTPILSSVLYIIEDGAIYEDALYEAVVGMSESGRVNVVYTTLSDQIIFEQADIGKTVFLTREEAKKALEAMREEDVT